jgi:membrane protein implicated in regulation of membrane protease activity
MHFPQQTRQRRAQVATYLLWAIAGFILITVELLTGTFYLLVLGVAALAAAGVAALGGAFWLQALVGATVALLGTWFVKRWWTLHPKESRHANDLDHGQTVVWESWVNETARTARVKYRGSVWDAHIDEGADIAGMLMIRSQENGVLHVGAKR